MISEKKRDKIRDNKRDKRDLTIEKKKSQTTETNIT